MGTPLLPPSMFPITPNIMDEDSSKKYLYTIIVEGDIIGHVHQLGRDKENTSCMVVMTGDYPVSSNIREVIYTHKKVDDTIVMADYPLQTLSSRPFVITYEYDMVYGKYVYTTSSHIPRSCLFLLMMIVDGRNDIIDYTPPPHYHHMEEPFVRQGYVRELKRAKHIIIPPNSPNNTYDGGDLSDLIIAHSSSSPNGTILTSVNGRKTTLLNVTTTSSPLPRYIVSNPPSTLPTFYGDGVEIPHTYTIDSLIAKTKELNDRLERYGEGRVNSMVRCLTCLAERMSTDPNKFITSTNYNHVV
jgi:hypothetical protein